MRLATLGLVASACALAACAAPLPKTFQYTSDMKEALVAFGVAPPSNGVSLRISRIDPATCQLTKFAGFGDKKYEFNELWGQARETKYTIGTFEPGTYVISNLTQSGGMRTVISSLQLGTIAFTVKPGDFLYLGDFRLAQGQPEFLGFSDAGINAHVAGYPGLAGKQPVHHGPVRTTFSGGGDGQRVPGCTL